MRQPRSCLKLCQIFTNLKNVFTHTLSNKPFLIWLLTTPPHLKYAATLACNLSLMACFADINVSQGSVATYAKCGEMFNIWNFFCKSVKIWQNYVHESVAPFFGPPCIKHITAKPLMCSSEAQMLHCHCVLVVFAVFCKLFGRSSLFLGWYWQE